jgi:hypothetical protein
MGRVQITPDQYPMLITSIKVAFIVSAVLCAAGILASLARGKVRKAPTMEGPQPAARQKS